MKIRLLLIAMAVAVTCNCQAPDKPMYGKGAFDKDGKPIEKEDPGNTGDPGDVTTEYDLIKIMSFNVLRTNNSDPADQKWSYRLPAIINMFKDISPDVVGLQECLESQIQDLQQELTDYTALWIPTAQKNFGTCLMYKKGLFNQKGSGYLWFSDSPSTPSPAWKDYGCNDPTYRTYIWADLVHKEHGYKLYFYTTHFPRDYRELDPNSNNETARIKCAQAMVDHAKNRVQDEDPVVFTGDFNWHLSDKDKGLDPFAPFMAWMKYAWQDLPSNAYDTYRAHNSFDGISPIAGAIRNSVDYIWYRNITPVRYRTVVEAYSNGKENVKYISDHYPIVCTATVPYKKAATGN